MGLINQSVARVITTTCEADVILMVLIGVSNLKQSKTFATAEGMLIAQVIVILDGTFQWVQPRSTVAFKFI